MRNTTPISYAALRLRLRARKQTDVRRALAPYKPVGFCAGVSNAGAAPTFVFGGDAVIGGAVEGIPAESLYSAVSSNSRRVKVARDTIFRIASISKVFGAASALRLVGRGKLSLDDDVAEVLGFSAGKKITLRQLITHTAALIDDVYDEVIFTPEAMPLDVLLPKSLAAYEPGTRFSYSNLGAGVVGMLVEAASGMLFDDFVRQEFFLPKGIDASFHPQRIVRKERMANCYYVPGKKLAYNAHEIAQSPLDETPNPRVHYNVPAGKLMISVPDLLRVFQALRETDPGLFVRQDHIGSVACDAGRGLGVAIVEPGIFGQGETYWGHQGQAYGAVGEAWLSLSDGTAAVLLTNGVRLGSVGPLQKAGQSGVAALLSKISSEKENLRV